MPRAIALDRSLRIFRSLPVGYNHPYFEQDEYEARSAARGARSRSRTRMFTRKVRGICRNFARVAGLPPLERYLFIEGGALAIENTLKAAMDWKVRKNMAAGRGERGHRDSAFPSRVPRSQRLHHEPNEYRSAQDRSVRQVRLAARFESVASISHCRKTSARPT